MKSLRLVTGLAVTCLLASASPAWDHHFVPVNPNRVNYYGGWLGYPVGNPMSGIAAQDQQASAMRSMGQNAVVQSGIRNTLAGQAQARSDAILSQRQANQDWWFQVEQQQMAAQQARQSSSPAPTAAGFGSGPAAGGLSLGLATAASLRPEVAMDVVQWPLALRGQEFDSRRSLMEAPYRRSPPGLSAPTANDYREMVKTVEEMKSILEWRLGQDSGLPTGDYEQAKACLNKIGQEASERAVSGATSPKPR